MPRAQLARLVEGEPVRGAVACVLGHLDNDWDKLEALLAEMLARRDQWLRLTGARDPAAACAADYRRFVARELDALAARLPAALTGEVVALAAVAGAQREASPLAGLAALPATNLAGLPTWQALGELFVTQAGSWRKTVDKRQGFPAGKGEAQARKARWLALRDRLSAVAGLRAAFARCNQLPANALADGATPVIGALFTLLRLAAAHLSVECDRRGRTDFTAFALAALRALGEPEQPTDLALNLDYQLRHLLIDEFQDTSVTQFELLQRLTAGWQPGDGRTLFLVGDPMQSIYRFRQAEVGLFQHVLAHGLIGGVALERLALVVNFRAQQGLVDWINALTPLALESIEADPAAFVPQRAVHAALAVPYRLDVWADADAASEAAAVCARVAALRAEASTASIAVLVRSRAHLAAISAALVAAGVPIAARDIKPIASVPLVADLLALARALLHPADRVAWFAVLRAPWCGLSLAELESLAVRHDVLPALLDDPTVLATLAPASRDRLARVATVVAQARATAATACFADVLEEAWIALGGPALAGTASDLADAHAFLALVAALEAEDLPLTAARLTARLEEHYACAATHDPRAVQLMTIHRAKGLEFDHVILPGLGRTTRGGRKPLLAWRQEFDGDGHACLLLAPLAARGTSDGLYAWLQQREGDEAAAEAVRLLYVALTRARRGVHLFGHVNLGDDGTSKARKGSFLAYLWPVLGAACEAALAGGVDAASQVVPVPRVAPAPPRLRRARLDSLPPLSVPASPVFTGEAAVEFDWAGMTARHIGTVTHRLLQELVPAHPETQAALDADGVARYARAGLRTLGVPPAAIADAVAIVVAACQTTLASARGRWLVDPTHRESAAELALATVEHDEVRHLIIDRTFVDAAGCRWIVDFKTGSHAGGGLEAWLDSEQERYRPQLEGYGRVFATLDTRPIRLGLYFPLVDGWREWTYRG